MKTLFVIAILACFAVGILKQNVVTIDMPRASEVTHKLKDMAKQLAE